MRSWERDPADDERAVQEALEALAAFPGLGSEPGTARALDLIARRLDPVALQKAHRSARAAQLINGSLDLGAVLRRTLDLALEVTSAERGLLVLRDGQHIASPLGPGAIPPDEPARAIAERVIRTGEPLFTTDAQANALLGPSRPVSPQSDPSRDAARAIVPLRLRSVACVPLRARDEVIGALYLDSGAIPGLFKPADRDLLLAFTSQATLAIENARSFSSQTRILEAIASGIVTLAPDRSIVTFNRAAETTFEVECHGFVGQHAYALRHLMPEFPELLDTFYDSGAVALRAETKGLAGDRRELVLEIRLSPLDDIDGKGVAIVVTDVTAQRALEAAHEAQVKRAASIEESFSRYLAPHVVQSLMHDPASIRLGGERSRATTLFADVRGFTAMATSLSAERVVEILNTYFEAAVRIVFEHDGLLDKFYGDGLMAIFGPPRVRDDDATRAVAAAIRLHEVVRELGPALDYPLAISVGLATGEVVAGHFGSARRMDYTVIGDAVNRANGLQSAAPPGAIYCDQETFEGAGSLAHPAHRLAARIKGRAELITAYAIFPSGVAAG